MIRNDGASGGICGKERTKGDVGGEKDRQGGGELESEGEEEMKSINTTFEPSCQFGKIQYWRILL